MNIQYPYEFDSRAHTATADDEDHLRQMIEQVLFTALGERVNRPDFGSGLYQLVFSPNSSELAAATQFLVKGSLQHWLGNVIQVLSVEVGAEDSTLTIAVEYLVRRTDARQSVQFSRRIG